jgi:hypothetical protein
MTMLPAQEIHGADVPGAAQPEEERTARVIEGADPGGQAPASTRPTLERGSRGEDVTRLINLLELLGYDTGSKGMQTLNEHVADAVLEAQQELGAVEDVRVGEHTWQLLYDAARAQLERKKASGAA